MKYREFMSLTDEEIIPNLEEFASDSDMTILA